MKKGDGKRKERKGNENKKRKRSDDGDVMGI